MQRMPLWQVLDDAPQIFQGLLTLLVPPLQPVPLCAFQSFEDLAHQAMMLLAGQLGFALGT